MKKLFVIVLMVCCPILVAPRAAAQDYMEQSPGVLEVNTSQGRLYGWSQVWINIVGGSQQPGDTIEVTIPGVETIRFNSLSYPIKSQSTGVSVGTLVVEPDRASLVFDVAVTTWRGTLYASVTQSHRGMVEEELTIDGNVTALSFGERVDDCSANCQKERPLNYIDKWSLYDTTRGVVTSSMNAVPVEDGHFSITNRIPDGSAEFMCDSVVYGVNANIGRNKTGEQFGAWYQQPATITCTKTKVTVSWSNAIKGRLYQLFTVSKPVTKPGGFDLYRKFPFYLEIGSFAYGREVAAPAYVYTDLVFATCTAQSSCFGESIEELPPARQVVMTVMPSRGEDSVPSFGML